MRGTLRLKTHQAPAYVSSRFEDGTPKREPIDLVRDDKDG